MKFDVFQVSRKGGRQKNEDRMGYSYTREAGLFVLADGMGGHPEGEVAAQIALQTVSSLFQSQASPKLPDVRGFLDAAVLAAHRQMLAYGAARSMSDSPRTTIVVCVVQDGGATWAHCGDSRLYLVRGGRMLMRTRDHSYAEYPEVASASRPPRNRNVLFTCLGSPSRPLLDLADSTPLQAGDRVLLCSDGLWGVLPDGEIAAVLGAHPVADAVPELVERALRGGGPSSDNVTVVAFEWESAGAGAAARADARGEPFAATAPNPAATADPRALQDFDDAAIERSIAEINDAIRRTARRSGS